MPDQETTAGGGRNKGLLARFLRESDNVKAVILIVFSGLTLSLVGAVGKGLGGDVHPFQISFIRSLMILVIMAPFYARRGGIRLSTGRPVLMAVTGFCFAAAIILWFWALPDVPLDLVIALGFTTQLFSILGAVIFLGEQSRLWRWVALGVGVIGGLIIVRPGFAPMSAAIISLLACYLLFAANRLLIKVLTRTDRPDTLVVWFAVWTAVFSLPPALVIWEWPTLEQWGWLVLLSCLTTANHLTMTWAVRFGDIAVIEPVNLVRLVWAAALGFVIFGDVPDAFTLAGGAVLAGAVVYITRRERREGLKPVVPSGGG